MIENGGITVEAVKKIQQDWEAAELKTKMGSKKMTRREFDKLRPFQRSEFIRAGGKVVDSK